MRTILVLAAAGAAAVLALAPGQDRGGGGAASDTLSREVLSRVERLEARVESLEAIAARSSIAMAERIGEPADGDSSPAGKAGPAEPPRRIMQLDGVETADPDPSAYPELERLRNEVESLERTVDQSERRASSSRGSSGGGSYRSYGSAASRQARSEGEMFAKYKGQLREKQGELKRLERELAEPRQIIFGNWEGKIITLQTTRDLSRALDRIEAQDYLTWEGRRVSEDENSQEWVVSSVQRTDAPPGH